MSGLQFVGLFGDSGGLEPLEIIYTGTSSRYLLGNYEYIELLTSGILTLNRNLYADAFLVGGGGGAYSYAGGGGGYTVTQLNTLFTGGIEYEATIGAGGAASGKGGATSISGLTANGGEPGAYVYNNGSFYIGGKGGSGGGGGNGNGSTSHNGGNGGSNGSAGGASHGAGGSGQGTTTRAFMDASLPLFGGGGGGSSASWWTADGVPKVTWYNPGAGGAGGGGSGQAGAISLNGMPNTGGGGGSGSATSDPSGNPSPRVGTGGSGIIILRWAAE